MNFAQYLMTPVTPLHDVAPKWEPDTTYRPELAMRRAVGMADRYRAAFVGNEELTSKEIGRRLGISKPLVGLRKLECRGFVEAVGTIKDRRGKTNVVWRWKNGGGSKTSGAGGH